jgi:SAM-dependent methyltransferase
VFARSTQTSISSEIIYEDIPKPMPSLIQRIRTDRNLRWIYHPIRFTRGILQGRFYEMYRYYIRRTGIIDTNHEIQMASLPHEPLVDRVVTLLGPRSVLDVGCGTATTFVSFSKHGVSWLGLEGSDLCIKNAPAGAEIRHVNLDKPVLLEKQYDLIWCFEVIEHIHPSHEDAILETLTANGTAILLSAAHPGQGGLGHFNERPLDYWDEKLKLYGFTRNAEITSSLRPLSCIHPENLAFYQKTRAQVSASSVS